MILVFAGAGASAAVNSEKYPTTLKFFEEIPEAIKGHVLFQTAIPFTKAAKQARAKARLSQHKGTSQFVIPKDPQVDIEDVVSYLDGLLANKPHMNDAHPMGYLLRQCTGNLGGLQGGLAWGDAAKMIERVHTRADNLLYEIHNRIWSVYKHRVDKQDVRDNWLELFLFLKDIDPHLEVFTTNYDMVLEGCMTLLAKKRVLIESGFVEDGGGEKLQISHWKNPSDHAPVGKSVGLLTKLHGSINWQKEESGIYRGSIGELKDHSQHQYIPLGYKGVPTKFPFKEFHEHFQWSCQNATMAIFIGFAFGDPTISEVIAERLLPTGCKIAVVNKGDELQEDEDYLFREHDNHRYFSDGFGPETIKQLLPFLRGEGPAIVTGDTIGKSVFGDIIAESTGTITPAQQGD